MNRSEAGKLGAIASRSIVRKMRQQRVDNYTRNPRLCKNCARPISYEKRIEGNVFCDRRCRGLFWGKMTRKKCPRCGDKSVLRDRRYCPKCYRFANIRIHKVEDAMTDASRRNFLIRKHGRGCWSCGLDSWMGRSIPIELDHVDGDSDNNLESNLRLLCPNCHAQTPTWKGGNKKKLKMSGREISRRNRYAGIAPM